MRITSFVLLFATLSTFTYADYIPGRMRRSAEGILEAKEGTGIYRGVKNARMLEYYTDDKGVSHYLVQITGENRWYQVKKVKREQCEDQVLGDSSGRSGEASTLSLTDRSASPCGLAEALWEVEILTVREGQESRVLLAGDPEHFQLSQ